MKKIRLLLLCFTVHFSVFAQDKNTQWIAIDTISYPVIGGQWMAENTGNRMGRLPNGMKKLVREPLWNLSQQTAGEYLEFYTNSDKIDITYTLDGGLSLTNMPTISVSGVDLFLKSKDGDWLWAAGKFDFGNTTKATFEHLLHHKGTRYRLYFPLYNNLKNLKIGITQNAQIEILQQNIQNPIIIYGTSIAQGASASRSGLAWTNILGRNLDYDIINLGFSGNGKLETSLLDFILQKPSRLIALDCIPNMPVGEKMFTRKSLFDSIIHAVQYIQKKAPKTPILLVQHSGARDTAFSLENNKNQEYLQATIVADSAYQFLKQSDTAQLYQLEASDFKFDTDCTIDGIHPNDIGMRKIAAAYETKIRDILHLPEGNVKTTIPIQQYREYPGYEWMKRHQEVREFTQKNQPKLIILGNSIMHFWAGNPVAHLQHGKDSWVKYIEQFQPVNMGFGWDRIENMLWRVQNGEMDGYKAQQIFVMAGTNNLTIGANDEEIIAGLSHLINEIKFRQPSAELFLSGIFPRRDYEKRLLILNAKISKLAKEKNVKYTDFSDIFLLKSGKLNEKLFSDGLHPNKAGYQLLGKKMYNYFKKK